MIINVFLVIVFIILIAFLAIIFKWDITCMFLFNGVTFCGLECTLVRFTKTKLNNNGTDVAAIHYVISLWSFTTIKT